MTWLKTLVACIFILFLLSTPAFAQTFEEFKKQADESLDSFKKETDEDFENFKKSTDKKFNDFVAQIDREFSEYLSESFDSYEIEHENRKSDLLKPEIIPVAEEVEISGDILEYVVHESSTTYQGPVFPGIIKTESTDFEVNRIDVYFLGWPLYFDLDQDFFSIEFDNPSPEAISSFWGEMSNVNYNHFLYQFSEVANTLNLNQWGYYQLLKECSKQVYPDDNNMQILFQWALLTRSRYKVKVGFSNDKLFLLLPSVYKMYNIDYVNFSGIDYYVIDGKGEQLQTYAKDFPEADILMDVSIKKPFYTNPIKKSKNYNFSFEGEQYTVNLGFDEEMIKYYRTIPLSDISVYFNSVVSDRTSQSVIDAFGPILNGRDDVEAANILLSFVQQAFDYKTDQQAYGTERYFFPDELLHYPYADCEDRSVLFAYLVKLLLNKEVTALDFPGHMATAICLDESPEGSHFTYKNKTFVVADPTFYGAPVGMLMPSVSDHKAKVIPLNNNKANAEIAGRLWGKVNDFGGFKADRLNDVVFDDHGNAFVCGYFVENADFDGNTLHGTKDNRDVFVAKFDPELNVLWAKSATGDGNDMAFSMAIDSPGDIYVYGSLENELNFSGTEITAHNAPDVFVAKYSSNGELEWATKAGLDKLDHRLDFMFAAKFNPDGEKIMARLYSQKEGFDYYGLDIDNDNNALIKGSFYATTGMNSNDYVNYNIGNSLDIPTTLHETDVQLKDKEYESTIAGLFAAFNLLKVNTLEIHGTQIISTFDSYNKRNIENSSIYENLTELNFLKNEKGIVTIKTSDGQPVEMEMIRIDNDARIRIVKYKSGNILVEVLSGINIFKASKSWKMNSVTLYKKTGDLLFCFGENDLKKKMNLNDEILKR